MANSNIQPLAGELVLGTPSVTPLTGALGLTGVAPSVRPIAPGTGALGLQGVQVEYLAFTFTWLYPAAGALHLGITNVLTPGTGELGISFGFFDLNQNLGIQPLLNIGAVPTVGALNVVGGAPSPNMAIKPTAGSLSITPGLATATSGSSTQVTPTAGALDLIRGGSFGETPSLLKGTVCAPLAGQLILQSIGGKLNRGTTPTAGSLTLTGLQGSVNGSLIQPEAGALTLTGAAPPPIAAITPTAGSLTLTGQLLGDINTPIMPDTGTLLFGLGDALLTPATGSLTFTMNQANPPTDTPITPDAGSLVLYRNPQIGAAQLSLTGSSALIDMGCVPTTGSLAVTGLASSTGYRVQPLTGSLTGSGIPASAVQNLVGNVAFTQTGTLTLSGTTPGASYALTTPSGSLGLTAIRVMLGDMRIDDIVPGEMGLTSYPPILPNDTLLVTALLMEGCGSVNGVAVEGTSSVAQAEAEAGASTTAVASCDFV